MKKIPITAAPQAAVLRVSHLSSPRHDFPFFLHSSDRFRKKNIVRSPSTLPKELHFGNISDACSRKTLVLGLDRQSLRVSSVTMLATVVLVSVSSMSFRVYVFSRKEKLFASCS
jgi:ABC-type maltose transport system permease subunit